MARGYGFLFFPVLRRGSSFSLSPVTFLMFLFFPVLRRGSNTWSRAYSHIRFYSSPSCDGDRYGHLLQCIHCVSILPRLATGIETPYEISQMRWFLFFPVLRRGSNMTGRSSQKICFYSSPSCDGDPETIPLNMTGRVSILPRLATGIPDKWEDHFRNSFYSSPSCDGDQRRFR